jgi:hypothetical protein
MLKSRTYSSQQRWFQIRHWLLSHRQEGAQADSCELFNREGVCSGFEQYELLFLNPAWKVRSSWILISKKNAAMF